jgi:hypothetical protein
MRRPFYRDVASGIADIFLTFLRFFFPSLAPKSLDGPISVVVLIYGDAASRLARHFRIDES